MANPKKKKGMRKLWIDSSTLPVFLRCQLLYNCPWLHRGQMWDMGMQFSLWKCMQTSCKQNATLRLAAMVLSRLMTWSSRVLGGKMEPWLRSPTGLDWGWGTREESDRHHTPSSLPSCSFLLISAVRVVSEWLSVRLSHVETTSPAAILFFGAECCE